MSNYLRNLGVDVRPYIKRVEGAAYIPWALALQMCGLPRQNAVVFDLPEGQALVRPLFGGSYVAVDHDIGDGTMQRVSLPLLDMRGKPIPFGSETARDVSDTLNRCRCRAAAIVDGLGLSLWSECEGNGPEYVAALAVTPDTDLSRVAELRDIKEIKGRDGRVVRTQEYLGWHGAVAACRITDPGFRWEVIECRVMDPQTGLEEVLPAQRVPGKGWLVGVRIWWKNRIHVEWLPIMGVEKVNTRNGEKPMEHQPLATPSIFHWHSAVMRCLAKAIALVTGYGILCYTKEMAYYSEDEAAGEGDAGDAGEASAGASADRPAPSGNRQQAQRPQQQRSQQQRSQQQPPRGQQQPAQAQPAQAARAERGMGWSELLKDVRSKIVTLGTTEHAVATWLGVPELEAADSDVLRRAQLAMEQRLADAERVTH